MLLRIAALALCFTVSVQAEEQVAEFDAFGSPFGDFGTVNDAGLPRAAAAPLKTPAEPAIKQAQEEAEKKIQEIRQQLEAKIQQIKARQPVQKAGLRGTTTFNGKPSHVTFLYKQGQVLPPEAIRRQFHDGTDRPPVKITFRGHVHVPADMTVKIWHAAGGVSHDHGKLYIDDFHVGTTGDDTVKNVIYVVKLTKGLHRVKWELTGGHFQHNMLWFENPQTRELLHLSHELLPVEAKSKQVIVDACKPAHTWPTTMQPRLWRWEIVNVTRTP